MIARLVPAVLFVASMILVSCNKGPMFGPGEGDELALSELFANNRANATQSFQVNAGTGATIIGSGGARITFGPNAFRTPNGSPVSGVVNVSLLEVMDVKDMVWLNVQTVGNDDGTLRLLSSGGAVKVSATQGGQELALGPQGMVVVVPTDAIDPQMAVFSSNSITDEGIIWTVEDSLPMDSTFFEGPSGWNLGYELPVDSMQWINCDYFYGAAVTTMLSATVPSDVPGDSTQLWIAFPVRNAVAGMWPTTATSFAFGQIAIGEQAVVIGLTRNGASYRSAFSNVTISQAMTVGLSFQPTTLQAFEAALDGL